MVNGIDGLDCRRRGKEELDNRGLASVIFGCLEEMEPIDRSTTSKPRQIVTAIVAIEVACPNILDFCLFDFRVLVADQSVEIVRAFEKECLVQLSSLPQSL